MSKLDKLGWLPFIDKYPKSSSKVDVSNERFENTESLTCPSLISISPSIELSIAMLEIKEPLTRSVNEIVEWLIDSVAGSSVGGFVPDISKPEISESVILNSSSKGKVLFS